MAKNILCEHAQIAYPIIGGAMYPCSNPELVAAVSESGPLICAGGISRRED